MRIVPTNKDGNCLFAACAHFLPVCHHQLRRKIAHICEFHSDRLIEGVTIQDWMSFIESPKSYIEKLKKDGTYGDGLCLSLIASTYRRTIRVWSSQDKKLVQIAEYFPEYSENSPITIFYTGNHYDVLELSS